MPRVAILGDIHGNLPALEAVLEHVEQQAPDEVLVSGDLIGRGPQGTDVVRRIAATGWRCVRGNHEDYTLAFKRGTISEAWRSEEEWAASRWMGAELSDDAAAWVDALPHAFHSVMSPTLYLTHGTPRSNREGLMPESDDDDLRFHLAQAGSPVLLCGHTHRSMHRIVDGNHVINVGSVGLPFNGDRRAQYAIVACDEGRVDVTFHCVPYDHERFLDHYRSSGFLAEGGVTSRLLADEVQHAFPCLVPFLAWARATGRPATSESLPAFRALFRPGMTIGALLRAIAEDS
jgi:predicted phosphodiesterase